jgi:hypothetical protein
MTDQCNEDYIKEKINDDNYDEIIDKLSSCLDCTSFAFFTYTPEELEKIFKKVGTND